MVVYFILRGDNEYLARGELKALLELYDINVELICYTMICLSNSSLDAARKIVHRAGFIKEAGEVIGMFNAYSDKEAREAGVLTSNKLVHVSVLKSTVSKSAVKRFLETGGLGHGYGGPGETRLIFSNGLAFLGIKRYVQDTKSMLNRSISKPFKRSIALTTDIARVLVNLTRVPEGEILLDPFAGTGSVLIEAWSMGIRGIGVDVDWELVKGMLLNTRFFGANAIVVLGDSRFLSYREVRHIATDLPYGRGASTRGVSIKQLYKEFIEKLCEYLSKTGYASFMAPAEFEDYVDELLSINGFKLIERYFDYVHGSLIRTINVVKPV